MTDLDAIRARLAAYENDLAECPDGHEYVIGTGWRFLYPEAPDDVRALLAALDAARDEAARLRDRLDEVEKLRAILLSLVDEGNGAYVHNWDYRPACNYCHYVWKSSGPEEHAPDCPVAAARRALEEDERE